MYAYTYTPRYTEFLTTKKSHQNVFFMLNVFHPYVMYWLGLPCWLWRPSGPRLNIKTIFPGMWISIIKIRRSWGIHILIRRHINMLLRRHTCIYVETAPSILAFMPIWTGSIISHLSALHTNLNNIQPTRRIIFLPVSFNTRLRPISHGISHRTIMNDLLSCPKY